MTESENRAIVNSQVAAIQNYLKDHVWKKQSQEESREERKIPAASTTTTSLESDTLRNQTAS